MSELRRATVVEAAQAVTVQFYVPSWEDPAVFAHDFRTCESLYNRSPTDREVDVAYARYKKLAVA